MSLVREGRSEARTGTRRDLVMFSDWGFAREGLLGFAVEDLAELMVA